jgi:hypothetical protein
MAKKKAPPKKTASIKKAAKKKPVSTIKKAAQPKAAKKKPVSKIKHQGILRNKPKQTAKSAGTMAVYRGIANCPAGYDQAVDELYRRLKIYLKVSGNTELNVYGISGTLVTFAGTNPGFYISEITLFTPNEHGGGGGCSWMRNDSDGALAMCVHAEEYLTNFFNAEERERDDWLLYRSITKPLGEEATNVILRILHAHELAPATPLARLLRASNGYEYGDSVGTTLTQLVSELPTDERRTIEEKFTDNDGKLSLLRPVDVRWSEPREDYAKKANEPVIAAEVHPDDFSLRDEFDAVAWFANAEDEDILELAKIGWRGDYAADNVARYFNDDETKPVFDYVERTKIGFECVVNREHAMWWLSHPRKRALYDKIVQYEDYGWPTKSEESPVAQGATHVGND